MVDKGGSRKKLMRNIWMGRGRCEALFYEICVMEIRGSFIRFNAGGQVQNGNEFQSDG
jgi:hypothetical protein